MREHFVLDPDVVFLNHGSFGACPRVVLDRQAEWQRAMERNPVEFLSRRSAELLAQARNALGSYVGAPGSDLVFVANATTAVNVVARSLNLCAGDEILATNHEYGACDLTWRRVCAASGASYRSVPIALPFDRAAFVDRLLLSLTAKTRLVFLSHITSATALIFPVAELCAALRERSILTLIDGAHAPGQIPLDVCSINADFYVGNCHKWMCAPKGSGFLYARPEHHSALHATVTSWGYGVEMESMSGMESYTGTSVFERRMQWQGTHDLSAWLTVPDAIEFLRRHNWPLRRQECHERALSVVDELQSITGLQRIARSDDIGQMFAVALPSCAPEDLQSRLYAEQRIEVPVTRHEDRAFLRVSLQAYNTDDDIAALIQAADSILRVSR